VSIFAGFNGQPVCQTRAKFLRSFTLASFSSLLCFLSLSLSFSMCVCVSDPREEEPAETAPIFAPHTSLSSCHCISPAFLSSTRRISRLSSSIRGYFRTWRHVRLLLFFIFLVYATSGPTSRYTFGVFSWFFHSRIQQYPYNMGHQIPRDLVASTPRVFRRCGRVEYFRLRI